MKIRIGTRGSRLALAQAEWVRSQLIRRYPDDEVSLQIIRTKGDRIQDRPLIQLGGKGVFVREIEKQIQEGKIDLAVHSMKDMPVKTAEGLAFTKTWRREDARDVLVLREASSLAELRKGAVIGTGSLRRRIQLQRLRPDLEMIDIRGNVDTRLRKMRENKLDGIVLAAAGLHRLGLQEMITEYMDTSLMVPAPAQGVLAIEIREGDNLLQEKIEELADSESHATALVEREFLRLSGGDCHMSVGAFCEKQGDRYILRCLLGDKVLEVCGKETDHLAEQAMRQFGCTRQDGKPETKGKVYLVGAGPGDPQLLTVKGKELISQADCLLYDRLAAPELLDLAGDTCEKIYVGKENHHHSMSQEKIEALLIQKAQSGKLVVRLKGGDPYVFGRGGEEALALRAAGIPYETVPGVTSAIAALAAADIPVTHRGVAGGFRILTAHDRRDELADLDFAELARSRDTLVFLMGLGSLTEIMQRLREAGMPAEIPAAVISHGTTAEQQVCVGTVADIAEKVKKAELSSPAVIAVGDVIALRERLHIPKCLIPKIGEEPTELAGLLTGKGFYTEEVQVGRIVYHRMELKREELADTDWLIFTSRHGVEGFFRSLSCAGLDSRALMNCRMAAVGQKTAEILQEKGIRADFVPEKSGGRALAEGLKKILKNTDKVLYVRGREVTVDMKKELDCVCRIEECIVYVNEEVPVRLSRNLTAYDKIFFTSGSAVRRLIQSVDGNIPARWETEDVVYSIGSGCTKVLREMGVCRICEAAEASYAGLSALPE